LVACDGAAAWEAQPNGQLKLAGAGSECLSQEGAAAGSEDAALQGAIAASSSSDSAHGAAMAVDGSSSTFWASAMDPVGPVSLTLDLGSEKRLADLDIDWEYPAKTFSVDVSSDGIKWKQLYGTDSNVLASTSIALGSTAAKHVKVTMREAASSFKGHSVFGIRSLALRAPRLRAVVEDCGLAAKSADARDKYFETYVSSASAADSKALRSELPSLEAARASLATVVAELAQALPKITSCKGAASFAKTGHAQEATILFQAKTTTRETQLGKDVEKQNGINTASVAALLKESRRIIVAARGALV